MIAQQLEQICLQLITGQPESTEIGIYTAGHRKSVKGLINVLLSANVVNVTIQVSEVI